MLDWEVRVWYTGRLECVRLGGEGVVDWDVRVW